MNRDEQIAAYIHPYAKALGASLETLAPGYSRVSLTITEAMTNFPPHPDPPAHLSRQPLFRAKTRALTPAR